MVTLRSSGLAYISISFHLLPSTFYLQPTNLDLSRGYDQTAGFAIPTVMKSLFQGLDDMRNSQDNLPIHSPPVAHDVLPSIVAFSSRPPTRQNLNTGNPDYEGHYHETFHMHLRRGDIILGQGCALSFTCLSFLTYVLIVAIVQ